jgi:hypothetical protein
MSVTSSSTPGQAAELVVRALELDVGDGRAFEAGQQDPAEAVADRRPEAALEGLGGELSVGVGGNLLVTNDARRQFQTTPTNSHDFLLCGRRESRRFPLRPVGAICSSTRRATRSMLMLLLLLLLLLLTVFF